MKMPKIKLIIHITTKHVPKPLHNSTQTISKWKGNYDFRISTTISTKHPIPIVLYGLVVEVSH